LELLSNPATCEQGFNEIGDFLACTTNTSTAASVYAGGMGYDYDYDKYIESIFNSSYVNKNYN
jgi:hypothetical protein